VYALAGFFAPENAWLSEVMAEVRFK